MKKFKILLLTHYFSPHIGGIETVSHLLAEEFAKAAHEVVIITWSKNNRPDDFPFNVVRDPNILLLIKYFLWAEIVIENNPCLRLSWPGFIFRKPNILILQTWIDHKKQALSAIEKLKYKKLALADKVVAISDAIKEKIWPQAIVVHNPYDENVFKLNSALLQKPDFVFAGRLVSDKGVNYTIKAIHKLIHCIKEKFFLGQKPLLTIIGDGSERKSLENLVDELQLGNYVHFTGALKGKQVAEELQKHKYLLVPSIWEEPFGIVALEGMACGCIPIVAESGGLPEAVGDAGVVFEKHNQDALISAIMNIENDTKLQLKMRKASTRHLKLHTAEKIAADYLIIIKQVLEEK